MCNCNWRLPRGDSKLPSAAKEEHIKTPTRFTGLRANALGATFALKPDAKLRYETGTFVFRSGTLTFLQPVQGVVTGAVFIGEGRLILTYLPISAYMDSTQRWMLLGKIDNKLTAFVDEVTPHEVSHQWWGQAVSWASYHDQWLSEGFAEFSASLFVQQGQGPGHGKDYKKFWERLQREIMEKQQFGEAPNDAGPLWLGLRLSSPKNELAYQYLTYPKGAYVLGMLRSLMWTPRGEQPFIDMMHDFVASHHDRPASTESFKAIAEKHLPKNIGYERNGRLDWFFNEWVYGTEVPSYSFKYELSPGASGHVKAKMTLTQSDVSASFVMAVSVFADLGKPPVDFDCFADDVGGARAPSSANNSAVAAPMPEDAPTRS